MKVECRSFIFWKIKTSKNTSKRNYKSNRNVAQYGRGNYLCLKIIIALKNLNLKYG